MFTNSWKHYPENKNYGSSKTKVGVKWLFNDIYSTIKPASNADLNSLYLLEYIFNGKNNII